MIGGALQLAQITFFSILLTGDPPRGTLNTAAGRLDYAARPSASAALMRHPTQPQTTRV
jgi:hypothetical protein